MVNEEQAIEFLRTRTQFGMKFGLENISKLSALRQDPHLKYPTIHIAGTNGKGSTASYIAAILQNHQLKVGLYTSPHLLYLNERIKINGKPISNNDFLLCLNEFVEKVEEIQATFFDVLTAVAFDYFEREKVDIAVIETGLGGRFDSTNIVRPILSVITSIGFDHEKYLGNTIESIAFEKAGIIKKSIPVFTGNLSLDAVNVIKLKAEEMQSLFVIHSNSSEQYLERNQFLAIQSADYVLKCLTIQKNDDWVTDAVRRMNEITGLRGRFDVLSVQGKTLIFDAAHNPDGVDAMIRSYRDRYQEKPLVIFGAVADKDYEKMLSKLFELSDNLYLALPKMNRGNSLENLEKICKKNGIHFQSFFSVDAAVLSALEQTNRQRIVICGSIYLLGEAYSIYFRKLMPSELSNGLTINQ